MQQFQRPGIAQQGMGNAMVGDTMTDTERANEQARLRQGIMHVRIEHFHCTLEEMFDPTLKGQSYIIGTGTGRPNEPGRVIDVSPAARRTGIVSGMPLRRAHRISPRTRFLPASFDLYQPIIQQLKDRYRAYSRIIESIPVSDAFIDLRGCEMNFDNPVVLGERLCAEIAEMGLTAQIGIAQGKTIAELAALMSRKEERQGVFYVPLGQEMSFVHSLSLTMLPKLRATGTGIPGALPTALEKSEGGTTRPPQRENRPEPIDPATLTELTAHLRDFGITTFAQVAALTEEGLVRRLGKIGSWLYHIAHGVDESLVIPDAPPLSQNACVHFQHFTDADETCNAIRTLANHLSERLQEQRLKGQSIALILWPGNRRLSTQSLSYDDDDGNEDTLGGQMTLARPTDEADVIAHHSLMLFAHYHRSGMRYQQVQLRIGDMSAHVPAYYPPPTRSKNRLTRKLQ